MDSTPVVRQRKGRKETSTLLIGECSGKILRHGKDCLPIYLGFVVIAIGILSVKFFNYLNNRLPSQVTLEDELSQPDRFIGQRAELFLRRLTDIGTKVVGSYENEVLAVELLKREISFVAQQADEIHDIQVDFQQVSGSFNLFLGVLGFRNYYQNVQNIVVKLTSGNSLPGSVLLNCHFDTVPESPGASDNGLNCAVLLEVLTKLSKSKEPLMHSVIFLFNGAEENYLQGSHGFITQHPWREHVLAVVNLDSAGAGGKEVLFQTTASNPWLVKAYAKAAPYPTAGVHGEELFSSGVIPSDTDFRIFRDFGHVPGLDLAHVENGYVYHTRFDTMDFIAPGVIQHTGDNILALVKELASSPELSARRSPSDWRVVYFDVFGLFIVVYSELFGILWNVLAVVASLFVMHRTFTIVSDSPKVWKEMALAGVVQFLAWLFAAVVLLLTSKILEVLSASMSWYGRPWVILLLYTCPLVAASSLSPVLHRVLKKSADPEVIAIRHMNGNQLIWTVVLLVATFFKIRSAFIVMLLVSSFAVGTAVATCRKKYFTPRRYILFGVAFVTLPTLYNIHQAVRSFTTLVPMAARMGSESSPETVIAGLSIIFGLLSLSYFIPLVSILRKPQILLVTLVVAHATAVFIVLLTPLGFPYSGDVGDPAPQRFHVLHCQRTFHDAKGNVRKSDSGFYVQSLDRNNVNYVAKSVESLRRGRSLSSECETELNCGAPVFTSRYLSSKHPGHYVPSPPPVIHNPTSLRVVSQSQIGLRVRRIQFAVAGSDHITMLFSPMPDASLVAWSFDGSAPEVVTSWNERSVTLLQCSQGIVPSGFEFAVDVEIGPDVPPSSPVLDVVVIGHYKHDGSFRTEEFKKFAAEFPDWAHVTAWTATYTSYVF